MECLRFEALIDFEALRHLGSHESYKKSIFDGGPSFIATRFSVGVLIDDIWLSFDIPVLFIL